MVAPSHLKSFQALDAAIRAGSLRGAADALAITPAAVGQRIKALEDYLGVDLLARGRSGLAPTAALSAALAHIRTAFRELEAAADALDLQRGHELQIAATPDFADLWLKPRLARFRETFPNALVCINGEGDRPLRLGAADCEIWFGEAADASFTDTLFYDLVLPISSPAIKARFMALDRRARLEGFPLLHLDFYKNDPAAPGWPAWIKARKLKRTAPERGIRFQRIERVLEGVRADAGLTLCGIALIADQIERGELALPFAVSTGVKTAHAFRVKFRAEALARPQIRAFRTWLIDEAAATRAQLARMMGAA